MDSWAHSDVLHGTRHLKKKHEKTVVVIGVRTVHVFELFLSDKLCAKYLNWGISLNGFNTMWVLSSLCIL